MNKVSHVSEIFTSISCNSFQCDIFMHHLKLGLQLNISKRDIILNMPISSGRLIYKI